MFFYGREPYIAWITEEKLEKVHFLSTVQDYIVKLDSEGKKTLRRMNLFQLGAIVFASVLFVISPWFEVANPYETSYEMLGMNITGLVLLALNIILFVIFLIRGKSIRRRLLLPGIRNVMMIPSALLCSMSHSVGFNLVDGWWGSTENPPVYEKYDMWMTEYLFFAVMLAVLLVLFFSLFEFILRKKFQTEE